MYVIWIYCLTISSKAPRTHVLGNNEAKNKLDLFVVFPSVLNLYSDFSPLSGLHENGVSKAPAISLLLILVCVEHFLPEIFFALKKKNHEITSHGFSRAVLNSPASASECWVCGWMSISRALLPLDFSCIPIPSILASLISSTKATSFAHLQATASPLCWNLMVSDSFKPTENASDEDQLPFVCLLVASSTELSRPCTFPGLTSLVFGIHCVEAWTHSPRLPFLLAYTQTPLRHPFSRSLFLTLVIPLFPSLHAPLAHPSSCSSSCSLFRLALHYFSYGSL